MLTTELTVIAEPVLRKVLDHPFWAGLRDGSLPGEALAHFVEQDTGYLLPAYARALARCAAAAGDDTDTALLGQSIVGTLEARDRLRAAYAELAGELDLPPLPDGGPAGPATHAHTSFFAASSARSFYAGIGALLPMVVFNAAVSDHLLHGTAAGSRYRRWVEVYHPGESYRYAVAAFTDMVDRAAATSSARQRELIIEQFSTSIRYEWAFAESCVTQPAWPL